MLSLYLFMAVFQVQQFGMAGIVFAIVLSEYPVILLKIVICLVYTHKKLFTFKVLPWQSFGAPLISTGVLYVLFYILKDLIIQPIWDWNFYVGVVIAILGLVVLVFTLYFPLTVFLGGWDDNSIADFKKIQSMVGPSSFIVRPMAKLIFRAVDHSKLHNNFKIDPDLERLAFQEMDELRALKEERRSALEN